MDFVTYYRFLKRNQIPFVYYRYGNRVKIMSKITKYEYRMSQFEWFHVPSHRRTSPERFGACV